MKKNLKKVLAASLAATMVMGMSVTAFATNTTTDKNGTTYNDMSTVTIEKTYTLTGAGESPAEDFNFTIVPGIDTDADGVRDLFVKDAYAGQANNDTIPVPEITEVLSFVKGAAGDATKGVKNITVNFNNTSGNSIYNGVGVYYYTIKETVPTTKTTGVTYFEEPITLVVTVNLGTEGNVRVAAVHCESPIDVNNTNSKKTNEFENEYAAGSLAIKKEVTGNLGDQNKYFKVTVTFNAPDGTEVASNISVTPTSFDGKLNNEDGTVTTVNTNPILIFGETTKEIDPSTGEVVNTVENAWTTKTVDVYLKHGETITFGNIPAGVTYEVKEADYTTNADGTANYDAPKYYNDIKDTLDENDLISVENGKGATGEISYIPATTDENDNVIPATVDNDEIAINNNKGTVVDTGISLDALPYLMMLGMSGLGALGFAGKRRKEEDEI